MSKRSRFVMPDTVKLPLFQGDAADPDCEWIEVKKKLGYGDEQSLANALIDSLQANDLAGGAEDVEARMKIKLNAGMEGLYRLVMWIVDWNLEGEEGPVEVSLNSMKYLDPETARELHRVISAHEDATSSEGKVPEGKPRPKRKSPSA